MHGNKAEIVRKQTLKNFKSPANTTKSVEDIAESKLLHATTKELNPNVGLTGVELPAVWNMTF